MKLIDVIEKLNELDPDHTIFAERPWSPESNVVIFEDPENENIVLKTPQGNIPYFLEIWIAQEFINDWQETLPKKISAMDRCKRLIEYAVNDA